MKDQPFDAPETAACATECTGLMPALETDHEANEASASLQGVHTAKLSEPKKEQGTHEKKNRKTNADSGADRARGGDHSDHRGHDFAHERG